MGLQRGACSSVVLVKLGQGMARQHISRRRIRWGGSGQLRQPLPSHPHARARPTRRKHEHTQKAIRGRGGAQAAGPCSLGSSSNAQPAGTSATKHAAPRAHRGCARTRLGGRNGPCRSVSPGLRQRPAARPRLVVRDLAGPGGLSSSRRTPVFAPPRAVEQPAHARLSSPARGRHLSSERTTLFTLSFLRST